MVHTYTHKGERTNVNEMQSTSKTKKEIFKIAELNHVFKSNKRKIINITRNLYNFSWIIFVIKFWNNLTQIDSVLTRNPLRAVNDSWSFNWKQIGSLQLEVLRLMLNETSTALQV